MEQGSNDKEFQIITKAKELCKHTLTMTSNTDRFAKKYRFTLCDKMLTKALDIYECVYDANYSYQNSEIAERNRLQTQAISHCTKLNFYIEMCLEKNIIDSKSADYWSKLVSDIKFMTIAWRKTDKKR